MSLCYLENHMFEVCNDGFDVMLCLRLDDCLCLVHHGLTSGFLKLWLAVLVSKAMSPLHCFIIMMMPFEH